MNINDPKTASEIDGYIKSVIETKGKKFRFNRQIRGTVKLINGDKCTITLLDSTEEITNVKIRKGLDLKVNDEIFVTVINNSLSNLIIDTKVIDISSIYSLDESRNLYAIENFNDYTDWIASNSSTSNDLINYKIGKQGVKIEPLDDLGGSISMYKLTTLDFTEFEDSENSTNYDYICYSIYIEDIDSISDITISFYTNTYKYYITKTNSDLSEGWNNLYTKKIDFTTSGTPDWSNITKINLDITQNVGYENYTTFGCIYLVENLNQYKYINVQSMSSSNIPNMSIFLDSSDNTLKYKDNLGSLHSLV